MTKEEATHFLLLEEDVDLDEVIDVLEDKLFPLKDYFLRNDPLGPTYKSRIKQLERLGLAAQALGLELSNLNEPIETDLKTKDSTLLSQFLLEYGDSLAALRKTISKSNDPFSIQNSAKKMLAIHGVYVNHFIEKSSQFNLETSVDDSLVKLSQPTELGKLINAVRVMEGSKAHVLRNSYEKDSAASTVLYEQKRLQKLQAL